MVPTLSASSEQGITSPSLIINLTLDVNSREKKFVNFPNEYLKENLSKGVSEQKVFLHVALRQDQQPAKKTFIYELTLYGIGSDKAVAVFHTAPQGNDRYLLALESKINTCLQNPKQDLVFNKDIECHELGSIDLQQAVVVSGGNSRWNVFSSSKSLLGKFALASGRQVRQLYNFAMANSKESQPVPQSQAIRYVPMHEMTDDAQQSNSNQEDVVDSVQRHAEFVDPFLPFPHT
ncbi:MAG: hypothetical protein ACPGUD_05850 [Parashewanella sp.]